MTTKTVRCETHGAVPWEGHIACGKCGAIYQTSDGAAERFAPRVCGCDERLMPAQTQAGQKLPFTARVVCGDCYRAKLAEMEKEDVPPVSVETGAAFPKMGLRRLGITKDASS